MKFLRTIGSLICLLVAMAVSILTSASPSGAPGGKLLFCLVALGFLWAGVKLFRSPDSKKQPDNGLSEREVQDHLQRTTNRHIRQLEREAPNREAQRKRDNGRDRT
jgi:hypothetical protein